MSNEQDSKVVRVVADADWLVKQVVQQHEKLFILLLNAKGETIANIPIDSINGDVGEELQTLRSWLLEQLEGASKAGMESREENVLRDWSSDLTELEKEVARLKDENERLYEPTREEMLEALGDKEETFAFRRTIRRCRHCGDPVQGGPTACSPCCLRQEGIREERKRWEDALRGAFHWNLKKASEASRAVRQHEDQAEVLNEMLKVMGCVPKMPGSESGK